MIHRKGKHIPRLPLAAFSPPNTAPSDSFPVPLPPTPSLITPTGTVDAHLELVHDPSGPYSADIAHLTHARNRAVVLAASGHSPVSIINALQS